jgi:hypothetical protein
MRNTQGSMVEPMWKQEAKRAYFSLQVLYDNLWERENKVIPIQ